MMKHLPLTLFILLPFYGFAQLSLDSLDKANAKTVRLSGKYIQRAEISKIDSLISLTANMKRDHRIFGYEKPNTLSKKLILISIFTNDVKDNPFNLPYGAYYETSGLKNLEIKFISEQGKFIKTQLIDQTTEKTIANIFFERKWFVFEK